MHSRSALFWVGLFAAVLCSQRVHAQARRVELQLTPAGRAQVAIWIESADGSLFQTLRLTQAVSFRGIGNRPGASQMNSGYRWPYGRREGVLPIWAERRVTFGGERFERVIFDGRKSEGDASRAGSANEPINTADDYFCLSFMQVNSDRDHLDAVSCASAFTSNKGRYLTDADRQAGYAEPFEFAPGDGRMVPLQIGSLYPPRRDVVACTEPNCGDHENVHTYNEDARAVMPEIDAVTMATPSANVPQRIVFDVPDTWPDGDYVAYVEINVEGDYNDTYNAETHATPSTPVDSWDYWAVAFGYPYRGQPSVLYRVPLAILPSGGRWTTARPHGYGAMHGEDGNVHSMDASITDDPAIAPGSGADRLRLSNGARLTVDVPAWDVCRRPEPPLSCYRECDPAAAADACGPNLLCSMEGSCVGLCDLPDRAGIDPSDVPVACGGPCDPTDPTEASACGADLACADDGRCVGLCEIAMRPGNIEDLVVTQHADRKRAHQHAHLRFTVPMSSRGIARYEVRVGTDPITDLASFERALPAVQATLEAAELMLDVSGVPGDAIEVDFGGLLPALRYHVGIRSFDDCNAPSEITTAEVTTTDIYFTTVTACFVATAAYGSPMAREIGVLRGFRDRHLMTHPLGRMFVDAYYALGPAAADVIRDRPWMRALVRNMLDPIIGWLD